MNMDFEYPPAWFFAFKEVNGHRIPCSPQEFQGLAQAEKNLKEQGYTINIQFPFASLQEAKDQLNFILKNQDKVYLYFKFSEGNFRPWNVLIEHPDGRKYPTVYIWWDKNWFELGFQFDSSSFVIANTEVNFGLALGQMLKTFGLQPSDVLSIHSFC